MVLLGRFSDWLGELRDKFAGSQQPAQQIDVEEDEESNVSDQYGNPMQEDGRGGYYYVAAPRYPQQPRDEVEDYYSGGAGHDFIKAGFIRTVSVIGALAVWFALSEGNAQFFAGFQGFSWDANVLRAYVGGFVLEAIALATLFSLADHFRRKDIGGTVIRLLFFLVFALASTYTQYLTLVAEMARGELSIPTWALQGQLISSPQQFLWFRSVLYNLGEVAVVFLVTKYSIDPEKKAQLRTKLAHARAQEQQAHMIGKMVEGATHMTISLLQGAHDSMNSRARVLQNGGLLEEAPAVIVRDRTHIVTTDAPRMHTPVPQAPVTATPPKQRASAPQTPKQGKPPTKPVPPPSTAGQDEEDWQEVKRPVGNIVPLAMPRQATQASQTLKQTELAPTLDMAPEVHTDDLPTTRLTDEEEGEEVGEDILLPFP